MSRTRGQEIFQLLATIGFVSGVGLAMISCTSPRAEFNERGITYGQRGEYKRALESFNKAIDLDPTVSDYFMNRGIAYYRLRQYRPARADLDQAIRLHPGNARAYLARGSVYDDAGEPDRALEDYGHAIRLEPSDPRPYRNRGVTYVRRGEFQLALADLDRAITLDPTYLAGYLTRACLHAVMQRLDRAEIDYAKARQLAPRRVPELSNTASVHEVACRDLGGVALAATTVQAADDVSKINGYGKTTWGMTPDQVLEAEAPGARKVEKPDHLGELTGAIAINGIQIGADRFNVGFYFDANLGLQQVVVRCLEEKNAQAAFSSLEELLTGKYGSPTRREGGKSPRVSWELPKTTIRLVHFNALGISRVNFSYVPSKAR